MQRPQLLDEDCTILHNRQVGPGLHMMRLASPQIAKALLPGQFVHMKLPGMEEHLLRRPFSVYCTNPEAGTLDILYQVVGFGTNHMASLQEGTAAA